MSRCIDLLNCLTFGHSNKRRTEKIENAFRSVDDDRLTLVHHESLVAAQIAKIRAVNTMHMDAVTKAGGHASKKPGIALMMANFHASCKELKKKELELNETTNRRLQMDAQIKLLRDRVDKGRQGKKVGSLSLLYKMVPSIDAINDENEAELVQLEQMKELVLIDRDHEKDKIAITLDASDDVDSEDTLNDDMERLSQFAANFHEDEQIDLDCAMLGLPVTHSIYPSAPTSSSAAMSTVSLTSVYESKLTPTTKYAHLDGDIETH